MKTRKLIYVILALVILTALFAGCNDAKQDPASPTPGTSDNTSGDTSGGTSNGTSGGGSVASPDPSWDFSGVKLKAICYELPSNDNEVIQQAINEALGFEIEWVICPASEGWAAQERLFAADPTIDFLYLARASRFIDFYSKGYLADLTSYIGDPRFPNVQERSAKFLDASCIIDGKYYGLPLVGPGHYGGTSPYGLCLREDLLAEVGMPMPKTIAEFEDVLAAFKALDPSKFPLTGYWFGAGFGAFGVVFARSFCEAGVGWWLDESDGLLKHPAQHPDIIKFVEKMAEWYSKGYIHPEFVTATTTTTGQLMSTGDVTAVAAWCTTPINPNIALMEQDPKMRFEFVKGGLDGPAGSGNFSNPMVANYVGIGAGCKNLDAAMYALDFFMSPEGALLATYGIEGLNYNIVDGVIVSESGDHAYPGQMSSYTNYQIIDLPGVIPAPSGTHYSDAQVANWWNIWYTQERINSLYFEPDLGLAYDYSTGDNRYGELETVADTYIVELFINTVTGKESISNWDAKIRDLENIALNQMVKERNEQWAKHGKPIYQPSTSSFMELAGLDKPDWVVDFVW